MNDGSGSQADEPQKKRAKLKEEELAKQHENEFQGELNEILGGEVEVLTQDDLVNYEHLVNLAGKLSSPGAVICLRSKTAQESLSVVRTIINTGADSLPEFSIENATKLLFAAILLGHYTLMLYKSSLLDYPHEKQDKISKALQKLLEK